MPIRNIAAFECGSKLIKLLPEGRVVYIPSKEYIKQRKNANKAIKAKKKPPTVATCGRLINIIFEYALVKKQTIMRK